MSDKNMIALAEIRNGYALNKYGNLTLEQISLIKYDDLCLSLIKENQELKKQLEVGEEQYNNLVEEKENLQEQLSIKTLQLEEYKNQVDKGLYNVCLPYSTGYNKAIEEKENQQKEFIEYLENEIYSIEPKGTGINYNCEYDSEEDYLNAMEEQSKLNILKEILSKYQEIIGGKE